MDQVINEKFTQEQKASLSDFRDMIFETEKKKKEPSTDRGDKGGCGTGGCGGTGTGGCH